MGTTWLLGKTGDEVKRLQRESELNQQILADSKKELLGITTDALSSPWGLAGCFGAGCLTEYLVEKGTINSRMRWSTLSTAAWTLLK